MARPKHASNSQVYQIKITLRHVKPPIWRRLQVPERTKLSELHLMIQAAMGWCNGHLHGFTIAGVDYSSPDQEWDDLDMEDEARVRLGQVVSHAGARFRYTYDFGDNWDHDILVEKILSAQPGVGYPCCLAGRRRCPPEDVGGPYGYEDFLEAIRNPRHEEHADYLEWVGGAFDPEEFDLEAVNGVLGDYRLLGQYGW